MRPSDGHPLAPLVSTAVTAGTLPVAFSLLARGVDSFWIAFVVGFGGVLPVSLGLLAHAERTGTERSERTRGGDDTALAALRRQYARGEIGDAAFERRLERLLETESTARDRRANEQRTGEPRRRTGEPRHPP